LVSGDNRAVELVGTFEHGESVRCAAEIDEKTFITGSGRCLLRVWDVVTRECISSFGSELSLEPRMLLRRRTDKQIVVCATGTGLVYFFRVVRLDVTSLFRLRIHEWYITCLFEMDDGSFVSGSFDKALKRWNDKGEVLQSFPRHSSCILGAIHLRDNIFVSASADDGLRLLKDDRLVTTCTEPIGPTVCGLVKLSDEMFVTASRNKVMRVWNDTGVCVETINHNHRESLALLRLRNGSLVTMSRTLLEIRRVYVHTASLFKRLNM